VGVLLLPGFVYGTLGPTSGAPCPENPTFVCQVASDTTHDVARVLYVVGLLLGLVYQVVLDARGGTIGKHLFDLEVVDAETGEPLGVRRAGTRAAARLVSFLPLGLGCFAMLRDPERRTWHDRMTDTAVVRLEEEPEAASDGPLLP
jgi:uncharacterized RDD family membrane protein YckC